jgi:hypothetical protein
VAFLQDRPGAQLGERGTLAVPLVGIEREDVVGAARNILQTLLG